jgi:hypothetical protein
MLIFAKIQYPNIAIDNIINSNSKNLITKLYLFIIFLFPNSRNTIQIKIFFILSYNKLIRICCIRKSLISVLQKTNFLLTQNLIWRRYE